MKNIFNVILVFVILALGVSLIIKPSSESASTSVSPEPSVITSTDEEKTMNKTAKSLSKPEMLLDKSKSYTVTLHTSVGDITIELDSQNTPITANNFYYLAKEGFYDGVIFHRTIPGFMIQGGDPTGTGTGSPGYRFDDEPFKGEYTRGTIAMANSGPDTNGSQFFIMHKDYPLPPNYVIFGHVTVGLDTVDKIATAPTKPGGEGSSPVNPVTINSVDIEEK